ncbi:MAG: MFS transporter [Anaerolineae bacterium]|nr:MFS transporter [Anaerolineales bacterium]MCQ3974485.1 MFS transporter [Anaerolineae bacterium]
MNFRNKATQIELLNFTKPPMRAFHVTWFAFFLCFFGWFGIAPLMSIVREDLSLTKEQIGNTVIASVFITIFARLLIGWLCDRFGPRLAYTYLLALGSLPVMLIGLSQDYTQFLLFRLAIGAIGASFVITQYHTSVMFAPNVVGTANATTAGWGNLGGGVTQFAMPLLLSATLMFVGDQFLGWRIAMVIPGVALLLTGIAYYFLTTDAPDGNFVALRARGEMPPSKDINGTFWEAIKDYRVWALFILYAACFGIELTINNTVALYFTDYFGLGVTAAGTVASLFGLMNLFARSLGGIISDKINLTRGLRGRVQFLFACTLLEGIALIFFSQMTALALAIPLLIIFSLFVQMSEGATYAVVPFVNKRAMGSVAGIVGAGGNFGAVMAGFLFRTEMPWSTAYFIIGIAVAVSAVAAFAVRFSTTAEKSAKEEMETRLREYEAAQTLASA